MAGKERGIASGPCDDQGVGSRGIGSRAADWKVARGPLVMATLMTGLLSSAPLLAQEQSMAGPSGSGAMQPGTGTATGDTVAPDAQPAQPELRPYIQPSVQPSIQRPVLQQPMTGQVPDPAARPGAQPEEGPPVDSLTGTVPDGLLIQPMLNPFVAPASALDPGLPPAVFVQPVPQSSAEQSLLAAPRVADPDSAGVVQADPSRVYGIDGPWLTGLAVAAISGLKYSASFRTEWTDNIARTSAEEPLRPGSTSRSDWRFVPEIRVMAGKNIGRQLLFANASLGYDFHARNTMRDKERLNLQGGLEYRLGTRCSGRLQAGYGSRLSESYLFDEEADTKQERVTLTASTSCRIGRIVSALNYQWKDVSNDNEFRQISDSRGHSVTGSLSYPIGVRGALSVGGFWQMNEYPHQFLLNGDVNKVKFTGFNVGGSYRIGPSLAVNGSVGRSKVDPRNPFSLPFSGTSWSLGANYAGPKMGISLGAGRSASGGSGGSANFSISDSYSASLSYKVNSRLSASAGYTHSESDNRGIVRIPGGELLSRLRKRDSFILGADYHLNGPFSLSADYRHEKRASTEFYAGYTANIVSLTIRASM